MTIFGELTRNNTVREARAYSKYMCKCPCDFSGTWGSLGDTPLFGSWPANFLLLACRLLVL